ncbi:MAG: hypothetical protein H7832_07355 [Magnetococcus sp. DMHC-6]
MFMDSPILAISGYFFIVLLIIFIHAFADYRDRNRYQQKLSRSNGIFPQKQ